MIYRIQRIILDCLQFPQEFAGKTALFRLSENPEQSPLVAEINDEIFIVYGEKWLEKAAESALKAYLDMFNEVGRTNKMLKG